MKKCEHPSESVIKREIRRRDGKKTLVLACTKCGEILGVICLKCGVRKHRNTCYRRKDGTPVTKFRCPQCGKTISLASADIIDSKKCIRAHEGLVKTVEMRNSEAWIMVFKCRKCGDVEAFCKKCKRWMWRHKTYTRKGDGRSMVILRCPSCGAMAYVDRNGLPPRKRSKKREVKPMDIEKMLGLKLTKCVYCGGKLRRFATYTVNSGKILIPRSICTNCGHTQSIVTLLRLQYAALSICPACGGWNIEVNKYGRARLRCSECGEVFDFKSAFRTSRASIPRKSSEEASRWLLPIFDALVAIFASKYDVPPRDTAAISLAARVFRKNIGYRALEAIILSPKPFMICRSSPDQATIQKYVSRIDIWVLQQLLEFTTEIVLNKDKAKRPVLLTAIDSTTATTISPLYPHNRSCIKFHGHVDIDSRVILDIDFGWSVDDVEINFDYDFSIAFTLGDKEYWVAYFCQKLLKNHAIPIASSKGKTSTDEALMVLRWLQKKHLKDLKPIRGIVEEIFSYLVPHDNILASQLSHTMMVEILVRAILWNVLTIGAILDSYVRKNYGVTLTQFFGGKGMYYEAKLEPLKIDLVVSLIRESFGDNIISSDLLVQLYATWFLLEFWGVDVRARISQQKP